MPLCASCKAEKADCVSVSVRVNSCGTHRAARVYQSVAARVLCLGCLDTWAVQKSAGGVEVSGLWDVALICGIAQAARKVIKTVLDARARGCEALAGAESGNGDSFPAGSYPSA